MRKHELKTWPEPFQAVLDGIKPFEIRFDDRGYAVGDVLDLREWDPTKREWGTHVGYTGRRAAVRVTYIVHSRFGLPVGVCVMGIKPEAEDPAEVSA